MAIEIKLHVLLTKKVFIKDSLSTAYGKVQNVGGSSWSTKIEMHFQSHNNFLWMLFRSQRHDKAFQAFSSLGRRSKSSGYHNKDLIWIIESLFKNAKSQKMIDPMDILLTVFPDEKRLGSKQLDCFRFFNILICLGQGSSGLGVIFIT